MPVKTPVNITFLPISRSLLQVLDSCDETIKELLKVQARVELTTGRLMKLKGESAQATLICIHV